MNFRLCMPYIACFLTALWVGMGAIGENFSITNGVSVLDALGERTYEELDVRELIGPTNYIEVVGYDKQGKAESAGYMKLSTPHWKEYMGVPKSRHVRLLPLHKMRGQVGGGVSLRTVSLFFCGQRKTLVQIDGDDSPTNSFRCLTRRDAIGDDMCVVGASQAELEGLDDNGGSIVRTTLYMQESGIIKLWYEILDRESVVVEKGCVSARTLEKGLCNVESKVVVGAGLVKLSLDCMVTPANVRLIQCHILRGVSSAFIPYVLPSNSNNAGSANMIP